MGLATEVQAMSSVRNFVTRKGDELRRLSSYLATQKGKEKGYIFSLIVYEYSICKNLVSNT